MSVLGTNEFTTTFEFAAVFVLAVQADVRSDVPPSPKHTSQAEFRPAAEATDAETTSSEPHSRSIFFIWILRRWDRG
jgi:hypothetical protein